MNIYMLMGIHDEEPNTCFISHDKLSLTSTNWKRIVELSDMRDIDKPIARYEYVDGFNGYVQEGYYITLNADNSDLIDYFSLYNFNDMSILVSNLKYVKCLVVDSEFNVINELGNLENFL